MTPPRRPAGDDVERPVALHHADALHQVAGGGCLSARGGQGGRGRHGGRHRLAKAGATEREMAAEICAAMIRAGSDLLRARACSLPANAPTISMEATPTGFLREATSSSSRRPRTSGIITPASCARSRWRRRPTRSTDRREADRHSGCGDRCGEARRTRHGTGCDLSRGRALSRPARDLHQQDLLFGRPDAAAQWRRASGGGAERHLGFRARHDLPHLCAGEGLRHVRDDHDHGGWVASA